MLVFPVHCSNMENNYICRQQIIDEAKLLNNVKIQYIPYSKWSLLVNYFDNSIKKLVLGFKYLAKSNTGAME